MCSFQPKTPDGDIIPSNHHHTLFVLYISSFISFVAVFVFLSSFHHLFTFIMVFYNFVTFFFSSTLKLLFFVDMVLSLCYIQITYCLSLWCNIVGAFHYFKEYIVNISYLPPQTCTGIVWMSLHQLQKAIMSLEKLKCGSSCKSISCFTVSFHLWLYMHAHSKSFHLTAVLWLVWRGCCFPSNV